MHIENNSLRKKAASMRSDCRGSKGWSCNHSLTSLLSVMVYLLHMWLQLLNEQARPPLPKCDNLNYIYHRVWTYMSSTKGDKCWGGSTYPSGAPEFTPCFGAVRVGLSLVFHGVNCTFVGLLAFCCHGVVSLFFDIWVRTSVWYITPLFYRISIHGTWKCVNYIFWL